jgi:hypothetical protein
VRDARRRRGASAIVIYKHIHTIVNIHQRDSKEVLGGHQIPVSDAAHAKHAPCRAADSAIAWPSSPFYFLLQDARDI